MIITSNNCTGCRSCELACSFHHKKKFQPETSSIKVVQKPKSRSIEVFDIPNGSNNRCDKCKGEVEVLCVKYCNPAMRDELERLIKEL